jgi:hypothetical protein
MAFFVLGIPFAMWLLLWVNKKKGQLEDKKFTSRYGVLFETYKPRYWWWDVYAILRRVILIGMGVWLNTETERAVRYSVSSFINLIFFGWHVWNLPFKYKEDNILEGGSLALLLIFTIFLGQTTNPFTIYEQILFGTAFLGGTFALICWMVYLRWALRTKLNPAEDEEELGPDMGLSRRATLSAEMTRSGGTKLTAGELDTSSHHGHQDPNKPLPPVVPADLQQAAAERDLMASQQAPATDSFAPPVPVGMAPMSPPPMTGFGADHNQGDPVV